MKQMLIIAGVRRMAGTGKQSGKAYDFTRLTVLEPAMTGGVVQQVEGYEAKEMDCEPSVLMQLRGASFPVHAECQLQIGRDNKVRVIQATPRKASTGAAA